MQDTQKPLRVEDVHLNKIVSLINADAYHEYGQIKYDPYPIKTRDDLNFILDIIEMGTGHVRG